MVLNLAIIGPGLVGSEFITQVSRSPFLRIVAVANSKQMVYNPAGLTKETWTTELSKSSAKSDLDALTRQVAASKPCVVIDCTSSDSVAAMYPSWLKQGLHVVTPNKKGFSGSLGLWKDIYGSATAQTKVYHESTVGAGLPILSTLKDLVETGDEIERIEGIFSGTLSYIFNNFSTVSAPATKFSEVVSVAKERGYTEPDPRDDLNGMDVARKVVILGRVAGIDLDLSTLNVENIVPEKLRDVATAELFMDQLPTFDDHFAQLNQEAAKEGKVLRYVGLVDPKGNSSVKLLKYPASHPFASLTGSDNIIAFTTKRFPSPLIIQGAGAGAAVTAFGMFSDVLKIARNLGLVG
ncbi:hypothetical protein HDU85_002849 [Gaertneriomyces sp. JEL0708]|nr:hypothetical protein HDU85_002849 [Gaertneriomyces sp. JEL0708]